MKPDAYIRTGYGAKEGHKDGMPYIMAPVEVVRRLCGKKPAGDVFDGFLKQSTVSVGSHTEECAMIPMIKYNLYTFSERFRLAFRRYPTFQYVNSRTKEEAPKQSVSFLSALDEFNKEETKRKGDDLSKDYGVPF